MEVPGYYNGGMILRTPEKQGKEDHFAVEDLLDFSNDGGAEGDQPAEEVLAGDLIGSNSSADSSTVTALDSCSNASSGHDPRLSGPADPCDICDPFQDLAELEWLSNFVEESFSSEDLEKMQLISGLKASSAAAASDTRGEVSSVSALSAVGGGDGRDAQPSPPMFLPEAPVPAKARSKRSRAAPCSGSSRLLVLSPTPSAEHGVFVPVPSPHLPCPPAKKPKKKDPSAMAASDGRRCLHCATDKTPQWRTGPMGPKTLCNACGVRYKSGRLVPEYRPAASPTFILSKHSSSHRKVLELRRQKEMQHHQQFLHNHHQSVNVYEASMAAAASSAADDFLIHQRIGPDFRQLI